MKSFIRYVFAFLLGFLAAFITMGIFEFIWLNLFTRPTAEIMLKDMPISALLIPLVSLTMATFLGCLTSCYVAKSHYRLFSILIGLLVLVVTVINQSGIPHPIWFTVATLVFIPLSAYFSYKFAKEHIP